MNSPNQQNPLDFEVWIPSEVNRISPFVDWLIDQIRQEGCVPGEEVDVELALREAVSNAVIHGNRMDPQKRVYVRCRCESGNEVSLVVRDQGRGFDPRAIPDAASDEGTKSDHGRGILLMKFYMDEVFFDKGGKEVHMSKRSIRKPVTTLRSIEHAIPPDSVTSAARAAVFVGTQPNPRGWEGR